MKRFLYAVCAMVVLLPAFAADPAHKTTKDQDTRLIVELPDGIKQAMLERMRRQLSNVHEIQKALAESNFDRAAEIAEFSLGLSSLGPRNARQAPYMPEAMQHMGMEMHRASSRVARIAQEGCDEDPARSFQGNRVMRGVSYRLSGQVNETVNLVGHAQNHRNQ